MRAALVFNPCEEAVTVRLSSLVEPPRDQGGWNGTVHVQPLSAEKVEDALVLPGSEEPGQAWGQAAFEGTRPRLFEITVDPADDPIPVLVPAAMCPAG